MLDGALRLVRRSNDWCITLAHLEHLNRYDYWILQHARDHPKIDVPLYTSFQFSGILSSTPLQGQARKK